MKRIVFILLLVLIANTIYGQKTIRISLGEKLEKEQGVYHHRFFIQVDTVVYKVKHIDSNRYSVPQAAIDNIDSGEVYYIHIETEKRYYWGKLSDDIMLMNDFEFYRGNKEGWKKVHYTIVPPFRYKTKIPYFNYYVNMGGCCCNASGILYYKPKRK